MYIYIDIVCLFVATLYARIYKGKKALLKKNGRGEELSMAAETGYMISGPKETAEKEGELMERKKTTKQA